jgi:hypothetical protein
MSRGYRALLADKYVESTVSADTKRVVEGEPQVTRPPLNILWRRPLCAGLPASEEKGNIVSPPRVLPDRPGWLEPDSVVYKMRTKSKKNSAEIRARTRGSWMWSET